LSHFFSFIAQFSSPHTTLKKNEGESQAWGLHITLCGSKDPQFLCFCAFHLESGHNSGDGKWENMGNLCLPSSLFLLSKLFQLGTSHVEGSRLHACLSVLMATFSPAQPPKSYFICLC
jgi:hypothetical protein